MGHELVAGYEPRRVRVVELIRKLDPMSWTDLVTMRLLWRPFRATPLPAQAEVGWGACLATIRIVR